MIQTSKKYLQESWSEIRKVSWPSSETTRTYTVIVTFVSLAFAGMLGGLDYLFSFLVRQFLL